MSTSVLLSIKPLFAEAILEGKKKYEFRRTLFSRREVTRVLIYASMPIGKIVGEFEIESVLSLDLTQLWKCTKHYSGIDKKYFSDYFSGSEIGYAIKIGKVIRYKNPLDLKEDLGIKRPPQSFQYLDNLADNYI